MKHEILIRKLSILETEGKRKKAVELIQIIDKSGSKVDNIVERLYMCDIRKYWISSAYPNGGIPPFKLQEPSNGYTYRNEQELLNPDTASIPKMYYNKLRFFSSFIQESCEKSIKIIKSEYPSKQIDFDEVSENEISSSILIRSIEKEQADEYYDSFNIIPYLESYLSKQKVKNNIK